MKKPANRTELEKALKEIFADQTGLDETAILPESHLENELGLDSLDTVELIMEVEEEFHIEVPDEDAEKFVTFGDVLNYLEKALEIV